MKQIIMLSALVAVATLIGSSSAYALVDLRATTREIRKDVSNTVESTVDGVNGTIQSTMESADNLIRDKATAQKDRIEQQRAELKQRLEPQPQVRKQALEGRRMALCQNRQQRINEFIDRSHDADQRHLENLQGLESKVMAFAGKSKAITDSVTSVLDIVDQKEAAAIAALQVMETQEFDCTAVDAARPSVNIQQIREAKRLALSEYRDSVVELIRTLKHELAAQDQNSESAR